MKSTHKRKVKKLHNSPYAIAEDQILGKGSFAVIKRAFNLDNLSEQLAVKIISVKDDENAKTIKSEFQILRQLPHHPNLVNCMKVQISSEKNFYIIMQYCNQGNLEKFIYDKKSGLEEEKIWFFLKQFCAGYKVLYQKSIVHRDIKPENILIHNGNYKIADFGLAKSISDSDVLENMSEKGTPLYMAPQLYTSKQGCSKIDVFSLGIIVYRLAFRGKFPFFEQGRTYHSIKDYFRQLLYKKLSFPKYHNKSPELISLIRKMLEKDKDKRISWPQIFEHEKVQKAVRNERRRQIVPMEQFRKSMIVVANTSVTDVKLIEAEENEEASVKEENVILIEEAFSKDRKSKLQKKLYHSKLLYTFIDIANRRIAKTIEKNRKSISLYILTKLDQLINEGLYFSLWIIERLQEISGDWETVGKGQLLNFEDIFENDREIISQRIKTFQKTQRSYVIGTYQDYLYNFLTEFHDFPSPAKKKLHVVVGYLLDLYDLAVKSNEKEIENEDKGKVELIEEEGVQKFQKYLIQLEKISTQQIDKTMKSMGLLFL